MWKKVEKYFGCLLILYFLSGSLNANAQEIDWHSFENALKLADSTDQPVLVDVGAPWCGWCHKMKEEIYPSLAADLQEFATTRLNRDNHDKVYRYKGEKLNSLRLAQKLKAETVPTIVFLTSDGDYLMHVSGFIDVEELRPLLNYISTQAYRHQTFKTFLDQVES